MQRLLLFLFLACLSSVALADLPPPPTIAELGDCTAGKQKKATDLDCQDCLNFGSSCETQWKPQGYEQRCEKGVNGYVSTTWCKADPKASPPKEAKAGGCAVAPGTNQAAALFFLSSVLGWALWRRTDKKRGR